MRRAAIVFLSAFLIARESYAAPPDEAHRTELYREGVALGERGDWAGAASRFQQVIAIRSAPKALIALAIAEEKTGHLAEAKRLHRKALTDAHAGGTAHAEEARAASDALARLTPRVPRVTLKIAAADAGGKTSVDDHTADIQDGAIDVDPGEHTIAYELDGRRFTKRLALKESDRVDVEVALPPARTTPPPASSSPPPETQNVYVEPSRPLPIGPIVVAGAGLIAGGVGAAMWLVGTGGEDDARAACGGRTTACPPSIESSVDTAHSQIMIGNVLVAVGATALIAGAVWWLVSRPSSSSARTPNVLLSF